ncbi:hypothetical protein K435DRAFT_795222 [Dendrothele bispora CBS 962.96]|uniref:Uncharacterized protein n=1 Tax=Dendrothele bispora (strain CBS 962.96) TaxID=1314807 RepID=A0A4V4HGJ6_DENBC|nr:hypothetical protein K435DRAFT_795222 [Dendrothele bispora CBS 962.96]
MSPLTTPPSSPSPSPASSAPLPASASAGSAAAPPPISDSTATSPSSSNVQASGSPAQPSDIPGASRVTRSQKQFPKVKVQFPHQTRSTAGNVASGSTGTRKATASMPKPDGENGRPNRGGYALKQVLGWEEKDYKAAQKLVRKLVDTNLAGRVHLPFTSQPREKLDIVRTKMLEQFPALGSYRGQWATDDFIKSALKYRQTRVKKNRLIVQAAQGQAVAGLQQGSL